MSGFRLFDLNDPQREAATSTEGPLLILAGAGTGKTRVITARIAYLIAQNVPPGSILAVTFTNKAANEMRTRLAAMLDPAKAKAVHMSTFHALCVRLLRSSIHRLGYKNNFTIYDESDQLGLIKKIITRTAARDEKLDPNLAKNLISKAKNAGWRAPADEETLLSAVFARYQQELKSLNAVDFDDLLLLAVQVLAEHPEARSEWQAKFGYLLVDEFQDTNKLQLELIHLLSDVRKNVCVVGDDDQSIYGWRGAEVSNILEFEAHFPNPKIVRLEQNYRSTDTILRAANSLIRNNPRRRVKNLWSDRGTGEKLRLLQASDDREEATFIAEEIHERCSSGGAKWEEFAVLFRMNAQSRLYEENLRRLQIPYRLIGGKSFFDRREVKDVLAYASILVNPDDDISLLRIINTPARGISATVTDRALEMSVRDRSSLHRALQSREFLESTSRRAAESIQAFLELIDGYETRLHTPLSDFAAIMSDLVEETGYLAELRRTCKTPEEASDREENVRGMLAAMREYQTRSSEGLTGYLDEVRLDQNRDEENKNEARGTGVTLITLHAAKGLEFPHVYLVGLEEGILPHSRSRSEGTVDEERRLLYVGITRAMQTLALSYCAQRMKFGSFVHGHPSSFLKELDSSLIEPVNLRQKLRAPVTQETAQARFAQLRAAVAPR
jgi:DNA helicase-2/ATP-dependent DNA helicase PcrA